MKNIIILIALCVSFSSTLLAQVPVRHATPEAKQRAKDRSDYSLFRRQISALKEFGEERKKIPALQKENKEIVKVVATIDSVDSDDTTKNKFITGYITQLIGDNSTNAYELTFDRSLRKITNIKRTGESADPEPAEVKEKKVVDKKAPVKVAPKKKSKDGDEDDDEEEEKEEKAPAGKEKDE